MDRSFMRLVIARLRTEHRNGTSVREARSLVRDVLRHQARVDEPDIHVSETTEQSMPGIHKL
ncbi:hypothetical protein IFT84_10820 [Rhizobium sp. CFBP 8762]|uniref:hypothetical protein n=1 Tax=Rhizobium sp. CFBP 8762 TaxID=2775279 RepID=UPI001781DBEF|nr:hypothetical protein [Rhizobium sp. CFBP 8762]MBD8555016.1 hypothetical protein [Rhizobium sp. CFBP 8762]